MRDVVHDIQQRSEKRHVLGREFGLIGSVQAVADVVQDLVDDDEHWPVEGLQGFGDLALVAEERLVALIQRVVLGEEAPQEALMKARRWSIKLLDRRSG